MLAFHFDSSLTQPMLPASHHKVSHNLMATAFTFLWAFPFSVSNLSPLQSRYNISLPEVHFW